MKITPVITITCATAIFLLLTGCAKDKSPLDSLSPSEAQPTGKRVYSEIKPVVLALPAEAIEALDGVDGKGNPLRDARIYFNSMTLVVYRETFGVKDYIDRIAKAFGELSKSPPFSEQADSWAVQMQLSGHSDFVVLSCSPKEGAEFGKHGDIKRFLRNCDYLMINDHIISNPEERIKTYSDAPDNPTQPGAP